jgi:anti-sigma B factor antagonist
MTHRSTDHPAGAGDFRRASFRIEPRRGCVVVRVTGEVDFETASGLHRAVEEAARSSPRVVIDFTGVSFIDSTGLGVILVARNEADARGGSVALVGSSALVRRLLRSAQIDHAFAMYDSLDEALAAYAPPSSTS